MQQAPPWTQSGLITARLCGSAQSLRPLFVFQAPEGVAGPVGLRVLVRGHGGQTITAEPLLIPGS